MLVKINTIEGNRAKVTKLDIDYLGSVIPLQDIELEIPENDNIILQILNSTSYAAIFTENDENKDNAKIILVRPISIDELNQEKINMINKSQQG